MNPMGGMRSMSVIAGPGGLSRSDCAVLPPPPLAEAVAQLLGWSSSPAQLASDAVE